MLKESAGYFSEQSVQLIVRISRIVNAAFNQLLLEYSRFCAKCAKCATYIRDG